MSAQYNCDPTLMLFVKMINENRDSCLSITVICNGVTISGYLISHFKYIKKIGKNFELIFDDPVLLEEFREFQEDLEIQMLAGDSKGDPEYLHISDFEIVNGMKIAEESKDLAVMRIKLSDVSGFMFGKWEQK